MSPAPGFWPLRPSVPVRGAAACLVWWGCLRSAAPMPADHRPAPALLVANLSRNPRFLPPARQQAIHSLAEVVLETTHCSAPALEPIPTPGSRLCLQQRATPVLPAMCRRLHPFRPFHPLPLGRRWPWAVVLALLRLQAGLSTHRWTAQLPAALRACSGQWTQQAQQALQAMVQKQGPKVQARHVPASTAWRRTLRCTARSAPTRRKSAAGPAPP